MLDARALIEKHKARGVLVDTNLLVLFLVGLVNPNRISTFKRTQNFTPADFDLLQALIIWFGKLFTTPHVLAEVSNLADLSGKEKQTVRHHFKYLVEQMEEVYDPAKALVDHPVFPVLGLPDAAIANLGARGTLVLTADLELALALQTRGFDALNFNYVRPLAWK